MSRFNIGDRVIVNETCESDNLIGHVGTVTNMRGDGLIFVKLDSEGIWEIGFWHTILDLFYTDFSVDL
jgi:hypothetical protein